MSYTPTLIILKSSFDKHKEFIEDGDWQYKINKKDERDEEGQTVLEYLRYVYITYEKVHIANITLLICTPTLSNFNRLVRDKLTELEIKFVEYN